MLAVQGLYNDQEESRRAAFRALTMEESVARTGLTAEIIRRIRPV